MNEYSVGKSQPVCQVVNCRNVVYFIDKDDNNIYPVSCSNHKFPTDIELTERLCPNCNEEVYFPINRYNCINCGIYRENKL